MNKKNIILITLVAALIISSTSNVVLLLNDFQLVTPRDPATLIYATSSGPHTLEIVDSWDSYSNNVLEQVVETLFSHDLRDPDLPRINLLAETYYWKNSTTLQIKLREGICFHDGTPFNASAAKWNLDRLQYLINATGTNTGTVAQTRSLWMRPDGKTPIINNTATIGEYNITIMLNGAYGPFLNTLTLINAGMISPSFHIADEHSFIPLSGEICGTGPFIYDSYTPYVEVVFSRWEGYWRHVSYFKTLQFKIFDNADDAHAEMLSGQIDFNAMASDADILAYEESEDITVKHYTDDTGMPSLAYYFLSFNNKKYNQTWREAMSYVINYTYNIEVLLQGNAVRANSLISPGFGLPYNQSAKAPNYDITKAREVMVSMGYGDMGWADAQWIAVAESTSPILRVDYDYIYYTNPYRESFGAAVTEWFKQIGIKVRIDNNQPFDPLWYLYPPPDPKNFDLISTSWRLCYPVPFHILNHLFDPDSDENYANINDTKLNAMMALALETTGDDARNTIYKNIQGYLTRSCFHAPLSHSKIIIVHSADLRNVPYNAMGCFQAYEIYRA